MLEVRDLDSGYGRVPVLHGISLAVQPGEVVLVLGGNGAGKTTLMRTIAGFIKPTRGTVMLSGRDITGQSPETNARQGLRLILDGHRVFPELSVADNIRLGAAVRPDSGDFEQLAGQVLEFFPILRAKLRSAARDLSGAKPALVAYGLPALIDGHAPHRHLRPRRRDGRSDHGRDDEQHHPRHGDDHRHDPHGQ